MGDTRTTGFVRQIPHHHHHQLLLVVVCTTAIESKLAKPIKDSVY